MMAPADPADLIRRGRAYVRMIETAQVLVDYAELDSERAMLEQLAKAYRLLLRDLLRKVPAHVSAEIFAASEKVLGTVQDVGLN